MYSIHAVRWSYGAMMCTETLTGGGSSKSIGSVVGTTSSRCGSSSRFLRQDLSVYWTVWPRIIKDEDKEESWYCHVKCFSIVFFLSWNFLCLIKGSGENEMLSLHKDWNERNLKGVMSTNARISGWRLWFQITFSVSPEKKSKLEDRLIDTSNWYLNIFDFPLRNRFSFRMCWIYCQQCCASMCK